jgi:hypothetical protein
MCIVANKLIKDHLYIYTAKTYLIGKYSSRNTSVKDKTVNGSWFDTICFISLILIKSKHE